tara:strand:- start:109 stop:522 length:414 start_codon:yes stop_codon:yes gene_type:complete
MKFKECPYCGKNAFESVWKLISESESRSETAAGFKCQNCSGITDHSRIKLALSLLPQLVFFIGVLYFFPTENIWYVAGLIILCLTLTTLLVANFVPLIKIKEPALTIPNTNPVSWQKSPILWLGIPALLLILYVLFK